MAGSPLWLGSVGGNGGFVVLHVAAHLGNELVSGAAAGGAFDEGGVLDVGCRRYLLVGDAVPGAELQKLEAESGLRVLAGWHFLHFLSCLACLLAALVVYYCVSSCVRRPRYALTRRGP